MLSFDANGPEILRFAQEDTLTQPSGNLSIQASRGTRASPSGLRRPGLANVVARRSYRHFTRSPKRPPLLRKRTGVTLPVARVRRRALEAIWRAQPAQPVEISVVSVARNRCGNRNVILPMGQSVTCGETTIKRGFSSQLSTDPAVSGDVVQGNLFPSVAMKVGTAGEKSSPSAHDKLRITRGALRSGSTDRHGHLFGFDCSKHDLEETSCVRTTLRDPRRQ